MPYYRKNKGARLSKKQKKEVKQLIRKGVEVKEHYFSIAPTAITNAGTILQLAYISQGDADNERVGDEIYLVDLRMNFDCIASQATLGSWLAGDAYNNMRVILFRWYSDSYTNPPTLTDVLRAGNNYTYLDMYNDNSINSGILHIVYDRVFILENTPYWNGTTTLFASGQSSIHNVMNKRIRGRKLGRKKVTWDPTGNDGYGHLYILMVSDSGTTPHPYAQFQISLRYTDS